MQETMDQIFKKFDLENENFLSILDTEQAIDEATHTLERFKGKTKLIQVGIGGSALGPQAIYDAFKLEVDREVLFFNNSDPYLLEKSLAKLDPKDCIFHIVSKSGGTAETIGALAVIINWLTNNSITEANFKDYFIFCTDPTSGDLRKLADQWNVVTTTVPPKVGGRFSVLTSVGILPAMFIGLDTRKLISAAQETKRKLLDTNQINELANQLIDLHKQGINQTVFMPYTSRLKTLGEWFVQLWAESLGKDGHGMTPIASYGATDQHSQMQLFMQGPKDKYIFFTKIKDHGCLAPMSNNIELQSFQKLNTYNMQQLINCQLEGTKKALQEENVPFYEIELNTVNEASIAELIVFFEILTATVGFKLGINPFDQPGVEAGKRYAFEFLEKLH